MNYNDVFMRASSYIQALAPIMKDPDGMDIGAVINENKDHEQHQPQRNQQQERQQEPDQNAANDQYNWNINAFGNHHPH